VMIEDCCALALCGRRAILISKGTKCVECLQKLLCSVQNVLGTPEPLTPRCDGPDPALRRFCPSESPDRVAFLQMPPHLAAAEVGNTSDRTHAIYWLKVRIMIKRVTRSALRIRIYTRLTVATLLFFILSISRIAKSNHLHARRNKTLSCLCLW
jgi:hypothetical protein